MATAVEVGRRTQRTLTVEQERSGTRQLANGTSRRVWKPAAQLGAVEGQLASLHSGPTLKQTYCIDTTPADLRDPRHLVQSCEVRQRVVQPDGPAPQGLRHMGPSLLGDCDSLYTGGGIERAP
ncbi:predicted protein [Aspergillus terreus NIH2624]|uniref:Uncharacterized protein n=1 Tax=Aspergillus terreus (strain NIH 2624 / FGSC A1156) TaxID=341663 RepID=Q0CRS2_ASPTN|nr:uncharacterized protein ATEG_03612 [Aspergillus terreus NIH2624]EAU35414.1 predicted protein [Aspergillus terreus NIH2624]